MGKGAMRRLNFGAGPDAAEGWESCDRNYDFNAPPDHWVNLPQERLDVADCSFDSIVASHSLQQVEYHALPVVLRELRRVLKHGGVLRVIMPDVAKAIVAWQERRHDYFLVDDETESTLDGKFCAYLTWYSTARCVWTVEAFTQQLARAGFPVVAEILPAFTVGHDPEIVRWDKRRHESFFVEAVKP